MTPSEPGAPRSHRCLTCGAPIAWSGNPSRPFCSLSCRLIDLGSWLDERYRLAGEAISSNEPPDDHRTSRARTP